MANISDGVTIKRIFIANRGEIARRIALTAKKLGIETVALTDRKVPPAYLADVVTKFVHIDVETTQVYLDSKLMVEFAKTSGADAIHPGFGFLSENAAFAQAVISAGLTWIGPNPVAIDAMASKATARTHAEKANVPCLAGLNGLDFSRGESHALRQLDDFAQSTGFPLLIKAAFGGGGKGMRIVESKATLAENAKRAATEAISSFGDGSLIVEKYLPAPRHVEVQVMADKHGNVCILGDRDCSLQRRHQKILEEAPAPNLPDSVRDSMHRAAKSLAQAVGYDNAGTVEFLVDESNRETVTFYFLEMNTRLQVEHTVTEEVFHVDLVEWQIRVARGEKLPEEFKHAKPRGHSVEVRIYAEDPGANFFPAPGPVRAFVPATGRGIRWEIGLDAVDEITTRFDPMISKLVCTAGDRRQALELVAQTLERSLFAGPRNNMPFLIWLTRHPEISQRPATTHFISRYVQDALTWETVTRKALEPDEGALMGALEAGLLMESSADASLFAGNPSTDSITATAFALTPLKPTSQSLKLEIKIMNKFTAWNPVDHRSVSRYGFAVYQNGQGVSRPFQFVVHQSPNRTEHWIGLQGHNWVRVDERLSSGGSGGGTNQGDGMVAPVPGKVIQVLVNAGDAISTGQILYVLESMKMQFEVKAAKSGIAGVILVKEGDQVMSGQQLGEWA